MIAIAPVLPGAEPTDQLGSPVRSLVASVVVDATGTTTRSGDRHADRAGGRG